MFGADSVCVVGVNGSKPVVYGVIWKMGARSGHNNGSGEKCEGV